MTQRSSDISFSCRSLSWRIVFTFQYYISYAVSFAVFNFSDITHAMT